MKITGKQIFAIAVIIISLAFVIVGFLILPDTLVMQITVSGSAGTTLPKLVGLAIPFVISVGFALYYLMDKKSKSSKSLLGSLVGIAAFVFTFVFNL
ncbi:MAG TPA: hypothetical protein PK629_07045 [Oscillospiraceae bacterium]|nr:hypothetical protein [Oscillospiraceae bacterium]HPF55476.1 hypothetical protein [Clostridiales bacterium]HPK34310.1 hypothetical protein [Oscillospiraceae bacterium]HPR75089.1 hypothetical protein [Oscillospiraceae bacterium]